MRHYGSLMAGLTIVGERRSAPASPDPWTGPGGRQPAPTLQGRRIHDRAYVISPLTLVFFICCM